MPSRARSGVAPLYLLACLLLGGSAQGLWQNAVLQLAGLAIIVWAAGWPPPEALPRAARPLLWIVFAAVAVVVLQLVPLPPSAWDHGARSRIAEGYAILGQPLPALPISLTPYQSLSSLLGLIPPLAMFCAVARLRAFRPLWLGAALLAGTVAGIVLGALQVVGSHPHSSWYLFAETNDGVAVGFFANANHMAMLLVISLPFAAAIAASASRENVQRSSALIAVLAGFALLVLVGIALNGSLAGFALVVPATLASALMLFKASGALRKVIAVVAAFTVIAGVGAIAVSSIGAVKIGADARTSVDSRAEILAKTGRAIADNFPLGTGLGSFREVYQTYESPSSVTSEYVVHAHNDVAELLLELGIAGAALIFAFAAWWFGAVWAVWKRKQGGPFAQAASIASAALLVHSLVEFPLRTAALAACFAMCLALLADRRSPKRQDPADLRPTRHLVIG